MGKMDKVALELQITRRGLLLASGGAVIGGVACVLPRIAVGQGSPVVVRVDAAAERRPISPLVYGVNYAGDNIAALNCPLNRNGGNNTTRYNWRENADNKGNDYFFQSIGDDDPTPGKRLHDFVAQTRAAHAASMITIPTVGWVAHLGPKRAHTWSYSVAKYGPQQKVETPYWPDSGNGVKPDGTLITNNDPHDANVPAGAEFMRPWIESLVKSFGRAKAGGVAYYLLDNEPALWHSTHRDVWPEGIHAADQWSRSLAMARMIKTVDPTAQIAGPEEWGWTGFFHSGYDTWWASKHTWNPPLPDKAGREGLDMAPWLLRQWAREEKRGGRRLLDVFSLHYYPQGGEFTDNVEPAMQLRRNRSTRSLWDTNYKDESWINDRVRLVPRMREWVKAYYPGTKTGLTEYSWGAEKHINGATTQADILGILGREGIDIATRWICPDPQTPTFKAFQMYRNYDGKGGTFGDTSVACTAPNPDEVSAFAARDSKTGALTVMLVAKTPGVGPTVRVDLAHHNPAATARAYQLTAANTIATLPPVAVAGDKSVTLTVSPQSITLLVIPAA